ncbi:MAG: hypothetical protein ACI4C3_03205 [Bacteroides sp.]
MGTYINRGNSDFRDIVTHEYVDKTSLIPRINATLNSESRYSCVTRCRGIHLQSLFRHESPATWRVQKLLDNHRSLRLSEYIQMNFDGLKDDIIRMLAGETVPVTTTEFQNDMHVINSRNDVLTVLIHLGYLAYDRDVQECYIPNKEVADEMNNAVKATEWSQLAKTLENSKALLEATIEGYEQAVARGIDLAHDEHTSC